MKRKSEVISRLNQILNAPHSARLPLIKTFQEEVWNGEELEPPMLEAISVEAAYDLDFYEPNEIFRKESLSFFGEDRLEKLIKEVIEKIENDVK